MLSITFLTNLTVALDYIPRSGGVALRSQTDIKALSCGAAQVEGSQWIVWPTLNDKEDTAAPK